MVVDVNTERFAVVVLGDVDELGEIDVEYGGHAFVFAPPAARTRRRVLVEKASGKVAMFLAADAQAVSRLVINQATGIPGARDHRYQGKDRLTAGDLAAGVWDYDGGAAE